MLFKEEIILTFKSNRWVARVGNKDVLADSLEDIDAILRKHYQETRIINNGDRICVSYLFDNSYIPEWIRQYSNHYFNREVEFNF